MDEHEGYLEPIGDFGDDGAFRQEAEETLADCIRKGHDQDAERHHLARIS